MNKVLDNTILLVLWILVTALAPLVGAEAALLYLDHMYWWTDAVPIGFIVWGIMLSVGQWAVLRTRLKKVWSWILFTAIGFPGGLFLGFLASALVRRSSDLIIWLVLGATLGAILGVFQWLVLQKKVKNSIWWIPASILSWAIGVTFTMENLYILNFEQLGWESTLELGVNLGILLGISVGVLSGVFMAFLLRRDSIIQTITPNH